MLQKDHIMSLRVYFEDCDLMQIMHHSRHICFFERARIEMLREGGLSLAEMADKHTYFAIRDLHIDYHYPARLDDVLQISTSIDCRKACSLHFKQSMRNQDHRLIAELKLIIVSVDKALKLIRLPDKLLGE